MHRGTFHYTLGETLSRQKNLKNRRDNVVWRDNVWRDNVSSGVLWIPLFSKSINFPKIVVWIILCANYTLITFSVSGEIKLLDYTNYEDKSWPVNSDCESVRMISPMFQTEAWHDYVTIDKIIYTGVINIILSSNFTVHFHSDDIGTEKGFVLIWNCISQWEEWTLLEDGTCRDAIGTQPPYNGPDLKYWTKYRQSNRKCGKLAFYVLVLIWITLFSYQSFEQERSFGYLLF